MAAVVRKRNRQIQNLPDDLGRGGLGVRLVDGRPIHQPFQAVVLETPFILIELGAAHPLASARF